MSDAEGLRYGSPQGRGVLLATIVGSGVAFLDGTVVNVALPTLQKALGGGLAGAQWTVDAYLLTLTALLLVGGAIGDRFGRRRAFVIGLAGFAVASVGCGLATGLEMMAAARAAQGVAAALLVPGSLALLRGCFHPDDQGQAIGTWSGMSGLSTALGPLLGGWLLQAVSWRLIFFINLPLAAFGIWAALRYVPRDVPPAEPEPLDVPGALTVAVALTGAVYALIEGPSRGLTPAVLGAAAAGVLGFTAFFVRETRTAAPMLPLGLFKSRAFSGANATTLAVYFALGGATFLLMLELQGALGYTALQAGASLLPITALLLFLSPVMGRLSARIGFRPLMTIGPLIAACGLLLLGRATPERSYLAGVLPGVITLGLGLATTVAPLTTAALSGVEVKHAGIASAVNTAVARLAGLLAVAILPLAGGIHGGEQVGPASFARAMVFSAALCAIGGGVAWVTLPSIRAKRTG